MSTLQVLYVDDEPDIREVAQLSLQLDPLIDCRAVDSGAKALELLREGTWVPDLVLLDVMMPLMDGPTTLGNLRALSASATTPVVFMTARAQGFERDRFLQLGAVGVIAKPFDPMTLAKQIRAFHAAAVATA
jgi:two-component system OmpR family response regulator